MVVTGFFVLWLIELTFIHNSIKPIRSVLYFSFALEYQINDVNNVIGKSMPLGKH